MLILIFINGMLLTNKGWYGRIQYSFRCQTDIVKDMDKHNNYDRTQQPYIECVGGGGGSCNVKVFLSYSKKGVW